MSKLVAQVVITSTPHKNLAGKSCEIQIPNFDFGILQTLILYATVNFCGGGAF